jgi:hypothetical protein
LAVTGLRLGKTRLVPIHPSTRRVLVAYGARRDQFLAGRPALYFFVSGRGNRLD